TSVAGARRLSSTSSHGRKRLRAHFDLGDWRGLRKRSKSRLVGGRLVDAVVMGVSCLLTKEERTGGAAGDGANRSRRIPRNGPRGRRTISAEDLWSGRFPVSLCASLP